jgi:hypothetical protein
MSANIIHENPARRKPVKQKDGLHRIFVQQAPVMTEMGMDKVEDMKQRGFTVESQRGETGFLMVRPQADVDAERQARDEQYRQFMYKQDELKLPQGGISGRVDEATYSHDQVIAMAEAAQRGERQVDND